MGAAAVEAYIHETAAPKLIGRDPIQIEAINASLINYLGWRGTGVETRGNSAIDIALWDLFGKAIGRPVCEVLGGKSARSHPRLQHLRRLQVHPRRAQPGRRQLGRRRTGQGPTRTSTPSCTAPTSSPIRCSSRASPA